MAEYGGAYDYGGAEGGMYLAREFRLSRQTYLFITIAQQMLAGGVIFGWQALLPVLYDYGVFADSCKDSTEAYPCLKMRSKLALVFSIAGSANAVGGMVAGLIMDRFGPRVARMFSTVIVLAGSIQLAYAGPESIMWFPGLACMGFGGNGIQITSFHISNLFPGNEKLVVSLIAGAFAASASLFTIMRMCHDSLDWDMRTLFLAYSGVCGMVFLTSSVWPDKPFTSPEDLEEPTFEGDIVRQAHSVDMSCHSLPSDGEVYSRDGSMHGGVSRDGSMHGGERRARFDSLEGSRRGRFDSIEDSLFEPLLGELEMIQEHGGPMSISNDNHLCLDLSEMNLWDQLWTPEWIGLLIFFNVQLLSSTYFMTAVGDQLSCVVCGCGGRCYDSECMHACTPENHKSGDQWLMAFGIIYPLGFITTPLCGYLQDRYQLSVVLIFVNCSFLLWQAIALVPIIEVQAVGLVCFSSSRQFLFSFFFAAVGSTFGYVNFGFLTGLANAVSAGVLMLNAPLYEITASHFDFLYLAFMILTLTFFIFAVIIKRRFNRLRKVSDESQWDVSQHEPERGVHAPSFVPRDVYPHPETGGVARAISE